MIYSAWRLGYLVELDHRRLRQLDVQRNARLEEQARALGHTIFAPGGDAAAKDGELPTLEDKAFGIPAPADHPVLGCLRCVLCTSNLPLEDDKERDPYRYLRAPIDPCPPTRSAGWKLYKVDSGTGTVLTRIQCIRALQNVLTAPEKEGGAALPLDDGQKWLVKIFAHPDEEERGRLENYWLMCFSCPWNQPIDAIREYAGEKVAFLNFFTAYLTYSLAFPTVIGLALFVNQVLFEAPGVIWAPIYAAVVSLWAALMYEFYKRAENNTSQKWGMTGFTQRAAMRREYLDADWVENTRSPVTGLPGHVVANQCWKGIRSGFSSSVFSLLLGIVIVTFISTFLARIYLVRAEEEGDIEENWGGYAASIINAVVIALLSFVYNQLAQLLTSFEVQPTDLAHEESLIVKGCSFQLINSFFPLIYVAFIKPSVRSLYGVESEGCQLNEDGEPDCLAELQSQLAILVITRLIVNNIMALANPYIFPAVMWLLRRLFCLQCGCILGEDVGAAHPRESPADREARRAQFSTYD